MKASHKKRVAREWDDAWTSSRIGTYFADLDKTPPSQRTLRWYEDLHRGQCSIITQMRTGHVGLNASLARFGAVDSGLCQTCREPETINHFLLTCRRFASNETPCGAPSLPMAASRSPRNPCWANPRTNRRCSRTSQQQAGFPGTHPRLHDNGSPPSLSLPPLFFSSRRPTTMLSMSAPPRRPMPHLLSSMSLSSSVSLASVSPSGPTIVPPRHPTRSTPPTTPPHLFYPPHATPHTLGTAHIATSTIYLLLPRPRGSRTRHGVSACGSLLRVLPRDLP
jgi:hypothetical protein